MTTPGRRPRPWKAGSRPAAGLPALRRTLAAGLLGALAGGAPACGDPGEGGEDPSEPQARAVARTGPATSPGVPTATFPTLHPAAPPVSPAVAAPGPELAALLADHAGRLENARAAAEAEGRALREVDTRDEDGRVERRGLEVRDADGRWLATGPWAEAELLVDWYGPDTWTLWLGERMAGRRVGPWTCHDARGRPREGGRYEDDAQEGVWRAWHPDGSLAREGPYRHGLADGEWSWWYPNGQLMKRGHFEDDLDEGTWTFWHASGRVERRGRYEGGAPVGTWTSWHPDGSLASLGRLEPDEREHGGLRSLHDDGLRHGLRQGPWRFWHRDGRLDEARSGRYVDGERVGP